MEIVGLTHLYCCSWRTGKEHRLCGSFCGKCWNGWQLASELMNDSKKSLALDLTVVTHEESNSRHVSFVVRKSIAFPCAQLLGDHRERGVNALPCWAVSGFRGNLPRTWGSWIQSTSLLLQVASVARLAVPFLWQGEWSLLSHQCLWLLNIPKGKFETNPLTGDL